MTFVLAAVDAMLAICNARPLVKATCALLFIAPVVPACAWGADTAWLDVESRIQYGYYTEDKRSLANLTALLASGDAPDGLKSYYAGLANYRLTLLTSDSDKGRARDMVERCVASLDRAIEVKKDFADALALQSACLGMLAGLSPWRAPFAALKSTMQIGRALQLAPKNPRVLLLDAIGDYERPKTIGGDRQRAFGKLKKAVAAFEAERQDVERVPGWGAAEAYIFLARSYLDRGDAVAARDALERALLIAPEFTQARQLMTRITSG
jgi:tetratricopeptide (TPR) repeat protein